METKTKVDTLFDILFYIYHNNVNNTQKKRLIAKCTELCGSGAMRVVAHGLPSLRLIVCVNLYNSFLSYP